MKKEKNVKKVKKQRYFPMFLEKKQK